MTNNEALLKARDALQLVESMRDSGQLPDNTYHKCMVSLAYEFLQADSQKEAEEVLLEVPQSYYEGPGRQDIIDDEQYRGLVIKLAYLLVQVGIIKDGDIMPTPTARA